MHHLLLKKTNLADLKSDVDHLETLINLKNVPIILSNLKSNIDKLDVDKLVLLLLI